MIITRLDANNVLKYERLELSLPEQGLIAISGQNESGKSSIGEAVCFALFGRTFSIGPDEVHKLVRWGQNHCSVSLEFKVADTEYQLSRYLDCDGSHSAKLHLLGEQEPLARGVGPVGEALIALLGFDYEQFVESFYLAQREITTPQPHSQAVKIMAGMAPLERVTQMIEAEQTERQQSLASVQAETNNAETTLADLSIQQGLLDNLQTDRLDTQQQVQRASSLAEEMATRLEVYCENTHEVYRLRSARSRASFFRFIFFVLTLFAGGVWWVLTQQDKMPYAEQVVGLLDRFIPQWQMVPVLWIGLAALLCGVLFLLSWVSAASKGSRIRELHEQSAQLLPTLEEARSLDVQFSDADTGHFPVDVGLSDAALDDQGDEVEDLETEQMPLRPEAEEFAALRPSLSDCSASARQVRDYSERELAWFRYVVELLETETMQLDDAISDEQARLREASALSEMLEGLRERRIDLLGRIDMREKSLELLQGAISHLSNNFNRDIRELVARILPLFTDGRYEHLQVDDDLKVRVFSNEKRDFMDLEEVSSGTQRQVMLALRLALSQKLLSRAVKGKQFAFLDEPFAFFDDERTRKALNALSNLSDDVSQVWIVAQSFPQDAAVSFGTNLLCERSQTSLVVNAN